MTHSDDCDCAGCRETPWHQPGCTCQTCFLTAEQVENESTILALQDKLVFYRITFWPLVICLCLALYTVYRLSTLFDQERAANATELKAAYEAGKHDVLVRLIDDFKRIDEKYKGACVEENKERDSEKQTSGSAR